MSTLLEVVIPNWNGAEMLEHCLRSLGSQSFTDFSVTVVDNGSEDGSVAMVAKEFPWVKLIRFSYNSGFSVAVNKGIRQTDAPWILLLNNDMEVEPDCVENLVAGIKRYPEYQFFALKMINFHHRELLDGAGDAYLRAGVGYRLGTLERDCDRYQQDREVFGACGGAAMYSSAFFERTGLFDQDFFAYLEDVDLNLRACKLGLKCMYLSKAKVYHIGSATSGSKINSVTIRLSTRNNIILLVKNYPLYLAARFLPAIAVYQVAWLLFCVKKGMIGPYVKGLVQGIGMFPASYRKNRAANRGLKRVRMKEMAGKIRRAERDAIDSIRSRRKSKGQGNLLLDLYSRIFL
ncbi:glycosyltransferase family 2 protein [Desulforhopalus singaporensis]|uniref:Glycosyltransferase 2-like domain-containing protein n=1 Tax=Desulforhopalus singaporensis TaxID=91360 RepID=A0A1H0QLI8_9BACT|nr:glycosyltransferase family 2 protein [Desulforhopalus singaporensis]SDP18187.1 hypothetical protein SAMN05660330_02021 [Desulforhopalus singaporensis]